VTAAICHGGLVDADRALFVVKVMENLYTMVRKKLKGSGKLSSNSVLWCKACNRMVNYQVLSVDKNHIKSLNHIKNVQDMKDGDEGGTGAGHRVAKSEGGNKGQARCRSAIGLPHVSRGQIN